MYVQGADQRKRFHDTVAFLDLVGKLAAGAEAVAGSVVASGEGQSDETVGANAAALFDKRVRPCTALLGTACVPVKGQARPPMRLQSVIRATQTMGAHVAMSGAWWLYDLHMARDTMPSLLQGGRLATCTCTVLRQDQCCKMPTDRLVWVMPAPDRPRATSV